MAAQQLKIMDRPAQQAGIMERIREAGGEYDHSCQCNHVGQGNPLDRAKLAAKLCRVMQACAVVPKDKQNPQQHYQYASSDAILARANPAFVEAGLATVYELQILNRQAKTTNSGGMWEMVDVLARLTIIDAETGATIKSDGMGQGYDNADKALSKAQTQARKYALLLALNISTGEDPEGDEKTDKAQVPAVPCFKCRGPAAFVKDDQYEGKPVKVYFCDKCKKETRKAA
jgi:hypothetical protein